jgi:hypothetical protein
MYFGQSPNKKSRFADRLASIEKTRHNSATGHGRNLECNFRSRK